MQQLAVRVGEWIVSPATNQLSRPGRQLTLEPRLIDLLVFFARHPGEVLSRDELIDNVWTRSAVTDHVVTQSVSELRKRLKDDQPTSCDYIVTVPKRGYRLTAPVIWCTSQEDGTVVRESVSVPVSHTRSVHLPEARAWLYDWLVFGVALGLCLALVMLSAGSASRPSATTGSLLINPRDIDIRLKNGNSCSNWSVQRSYAVGVGGLIATYFNTFSTFIVHDKTDFNYPESNGAGKTLTIEFTNQRHYRTKQCFMSVQLVDNADSSIMLDRRYFITRDNQLSIQSDLIASLSEVLKEPPSPRMRAMLAQYLPPQGIALAQFYQAHRLLLTCRTDALDKASMQLDAISRQWPTFTYARAEKILVDVLRHSLQPLEGKALVNLNAGIANLTTIPGMQDNAIYYQIKTIDLVGQGKIDEAYRTINMGIKREMSWLNYVLLGKVYEMKGENHQAADAYITAFNLRPGEDTLYWIENAVFQSSVEKVVPYLKYFNARKEQATSTHSL